MLLPRAFAVWAPPHCRPSATPSDQKTEQAAASHLREAHPSNSPFFVLQLTLATCRQSTIRQHARRVRQTRAPAFAFLPGEVASPPFPAGAPPGAKARRRPLIFPRAFSSKSVRATRHYMSNEIPRNSLKTTIRPTRHASLKLGVRIALICPSGNATHLAQPRTRARAALHLTQLRRRPTILPSL